MLWVFQINFLLRVRVFFVSAAVNRKVGNFFDVIVRKASAGSIDNGDSGLVSLF